MQKVLQPMSNQVTTASNQMPTTAIPSAQARAMQQRAAKMLAATPVQPMRQSATTMAPMTQAQPLSKPCKEMAPVTPMQPKQMRQMATAIMTTSLANLGYSVKVAEGQNVSAVEARKGHEVRLIAINDAMQVTRDVAGLGDSSCLETNVSIHKECERNGLLLEVVEDYRHGDIDGGSLISLAGRKHAVNLAEGYVAASEGVTNPCSIMSGGITANNEFASDQTTNWERA